MRPFLSHEPASASERTRALALGAAVALLVASCGSSSSNADGSAATATRTGQLVYRVTVDVGDLIPSLSDDHLAWLKNNGVVVQGSTWTMPDAPAIGIVEIDGVRTLTDDHGLFQGNAAAKGTAKLFRQLTDTIPFATFDVGGLGDPSNAPPPVVPIAISSKLSPNVDCGGPTTVLDMTPPVSPKAGLLPVCPVRDISQCPSAGRCCLDQDGPFSTGEVFDRHVPGLSPLEKAYCFKRAVDNWEGSTCFKWALGLNGTACLNEAGYSLLGGPSCRNNHKGRMCQELDPNAFSIEVASDSPSTAPVVAPGGTLSIKITNNTPGNESEIKIWSDDPGASPGTLAGAGLDGSPGDASRTLRHWEPLPQPFPSRDGDESHFEHHVDRVLTFTAPASLGGKTSVTNTIGVWSYGKIVQLDITITQSCFWCNCPADGYSPGYYTDESQCLSRCHAGLGCFTGICTRAAASNCAK
jgi:hypothetical protein